MKMTVFIFILIAGLVLAAVLVRRQPHGVRPRPVPAAVDGERRETLRAGEADPASAATGESGWSARLRREEERQRPWEGRN